MHSNIPGYVAFDSIATEMSRERDVRCPPARNRIAELGDVSNVSERSPHSIMSPTGRLPSVRKSRVRATIGNCPGR
jgi:hypothetical protein